VLQPYTFSKLTDLNNTDISILQYPGNTDASSGLGEFKLCHTLYAGLTAARNMLGRNEEINTIPFFWTSQYGKSIRYCGKYPLSLFSIALFFIISDTGLL